MAAVVTQMNRNSPGASRSISKSIEGFLKFKTAEGLSQGTVASYEYTLNQWLKTISNWSVSEIQKAGNLRPGNGLSSTSNPGKVRRSFLNPYFPLSQLPDVPVYHRPKEWNHPSAAAHPAAFAGHGGTHAQG